MVFCISAHAQTARIYNAENKLWKADSTREYFIVLKNHKCCARCFAQIDKFLHDTLNKRTVFCLTQADSSTFARRVENEKLMDLMPHLEGVLFNYNDKSDWAFGDAAPGNSVFTEYNVGTTPAILYISKNRTKFIPFEKLYTGGHINQKYLSDITSPGETMAIARP